MTQITKDVITWLKQWFYEKDEVDTALNGKQATLVSGTNLKTINSTSLLGSGNISISASGTVDSALSTTSENPVQNKIITNALNDKQDSLVSGTSIKTINNETLLGSGNISIQQGVWQSISLTNGTLYVNENERLCELRYSKSGVNLTANTWKDVETITQITSYAPMNDNLFLQCGSPNVIARVKSDGKIQGNSSTTGNYAIAFSTMWHY